MHMSRDLNLDTTSGLSMVWIVFAHSMQVFNLTNTIVYTLGLKIFFFAVPWFYFKAGYVWKSSENIKQFILQKKNDYLVPLLVWFFFGYTIRIITIIPDLNWPIWKIVLHPLYVFLISGDIVGNPALWFIWSLFLVKVIAHFLSAKLLIKSLVLIIIAIVAVVTEPKLGLLYLGIHSLLFGSMYFIAGVIAKQIQVSNQKLAVVLSTSIFIAIYTPSLIDIHTHKLEYGSAWLYVISSMFFYYALSKTRFDNKALVFIGQKSLAIFVVHFPVLLLIKWVEFDFCKTIYLSIIASIVAIASSITIAIILRNQKILGARIV